MENKMINESLRKMVKEAMEDAVKRRMIEPDPDPETVETIEKLEEENNRTTDDLLLGAMENVCSLIRLRVTEVEEWGSDSERIAEINHSVAELAETAVRMHSRLSMRSTLDRLYTMREVEQKNDENIRKWSDEHEQGDSGPRGDQSEG